MLVRFEGAVEEVILEMLENDRELCIWFAVADFELRWPFLLTFPLSLLFTPNSVRNQDPSCCESRLNTPARHIEACGNICCNFWLCLFDFLLQWRRRLDFRVWQ